MELLREAEKLLTKHMDILCAEKLELDSVNHNEEVEALKARTRDFLNFLGSELTEENFYFVAIEIYGKNPHEFARFSCTLKLTEPEQFGGAVEAVVNAQEYGFEDQSYAVVGLSEVDQFASKMWESLVGCKNLNKKAIK